MKKTAKDHRMTARKLFRKAGKIFSSINSSSQAASCFYSGLDFGQAAAEYEKSNNFGQAGECFFKIKQYSKAAVMFEKANLIHRVISCHEVDESWEKLLHSLNKHKSYFKEEERQALVNKYVPIALN
jgi:tetratricopeptide (TPR) repeat protein